MDNLRLFSNDAHPWGSFLVRLQWNACCSFAQGNNFKSEN